MCAIPFACGGVLGCVLVVGRVDLQTPSPATTPQADKPRAETSTSTPLLLDEYADSRTRLMVWHTRADTAVHNTTRSCG